MTRTTPRSQLNDDVDVLYGECNPAWVMARGKAKVQEAASVAAHKSSGTYVWRDFYSVTLYIPVCRNCGVPIRGLTKVQAFNRRVA